MKNKTKKNFLTIILARKNSVRIKNKNLRKIQGKSLVENTMIFALGLKKISTIILSSDSEKILKISEKYKEIIIHPRQRKFSGSKSKSLVLVSRIITWFIKKYNMHPKGIILLQPTTPFRKNRTIIKSIKDFKKDNYQFNYFSVSSDKFKNNLYLEKSSKLLKLDINKTKPNCYVNGSFYLFNPLKIKNSVKETILEYKTKGVIIRSLKFSIDIDEHKHLNLARSLI